METRKFLKRMGGRLPQEGGVDARYPGEHLGGKGSASPVSVHCGMGSSV